MFSVDSLLDTIHQTDDDIKNDLISSIEVVVRKSFREKLGKDLLGDESMVTLGITNLVKQRAQECFGESTLKKSRKNKYGLEMTQLEQELDDIKLKLNGKNIEMYQGARYEHSKHGKEDAVQFFNRVYWEYKKGNCIFQDDLLAIDQKLYKSLSNLLDRKNNGSSKYNFSFAEFVPTSSDRLLIIKEKLVSVNSKVSNFASVLKRNRTK